jgi:hypothetical protein
LLKRTEAVGAHLQSWFKSFANLAEFNVTAAVSEAAPGVVDFSTNPLIAPSLGTFAGVAARKATDDAALWEFGIDATFTRKNDGGEKPRAGGYCAGKTAGHHSGRPKLDACRIVYPLDPMTS